VYFVTKQRKKIMGFWVLTEVIERRSRVLTTKHWETIQKMMKKLDILVNIANLNNMHNSGWTIIEIQNYRNFAEDYSGVCIKTRLRDEETRSIRGLWGSWKGMLVTANMLSYGYWKSLCLKKNGSEHL
jgi:hypothetical protein